MYEMQKGKALDKLPGKIDFEHTEYLVSTKFDGNRIFIVKQDGKIRCFTSDWKEFSFPVTTKGELLGDLLDNDLDFIIEAEFNYNSVGKLGDRVHSAILTTWRTNFNKGTNYISDDVEHRVQIRAFDFLRIIGGSTVFFTDTYTQRLVNLSKTILPKCIKPITTTRASGAVAIELARMQAKEGWEGMMCVEPNSWYTPGKRGNHIVKLKYRKTADLLCIGTLAGEGKYKGMIGALVLKDTKGRQVSVGSGLDDNDRLKPRDWYTGKIIEIEYEQVLDTYIQPTFVRVRDDKQVSD